LVEKVVLVIVDKHVAIAELGEDIAGEVDGNDRLNVQRALVSIIMPTGAKSHVPLEGKLMRLAIGFSVIFARSSAESLPCSVAGSCGLREGAGVSAQAKTGKIASRGFAERVFEGAARASII
jgi:hypothetical protein